MIQKCLNLSHNFSVLYSPVAKYLLLILLEKHPVVPHVRVHHPFEKKNLEILLL